MRLRDAAGGHPQQLALNQRLDAGTNPPEVQAILDAASQDYLGAAKLLGAGGGGYLLLFGKDEEAARQDQATLTAAIRLMPAPASLTSASRKPGCS